MQLKVSELFKENLLSKQLTADSGNGSEKKSFVSWSLLTQNALSTGASQPLSSLCGFLPTRGLPVFLTHLFPLDHKAPLVPL